MNPREGCDCETIVGHIPVTANLLIAIEVTLAERTGPDV